MMKIAARQDYWSDKASEAYKRYAAEPRINDGRNWSRDPSSAWQAYQAAGDEIGELLMPFERLSGRRWEWRAGGIGDKCWRTP
jgi:hypothetical protein